MLRRSTACQGRSDSTDQCIEVDRDGAVDLDHRPATGDGFGGVGGVEARRVHLGVVMHRMPPAARPAGRPVEEPALRQFTIAATEHLDDRPGQRGDPGRANPARKLASRIAAGQSAATAYITSRAASPRSRENSTGDVASAVDDNRSYSASLMVSLLSSGTPSRRDSAPASVVLPLPGGPPSTTKLTGPVAAARARWPSRIPWPVPTVLAPTGVGRRSVPRRVFRQR
jgi:hypothetical protein